MTPLDVGLTLVGRPIGTGSDGRVGRRDPPSDGVGLGVGVGVAEAVARGLAAADLAEASEGDADADPDGLPAADAGRGLVAAAVGAVGAGVGSAEPAGVAAPVVPAATGPGPAEPTTGVGVADVTLDPGMTNSVEGRPVPPDVGPSAEGAGVPAVPPGTEKVPTPSAATSATAPAPVTVAGTASLGCEGLR